MATKVGEQEWGFRGNIWGILGLPLMIWGFLGHSLVMIFFWGGGESPIGDSWVFGSPVGYNIGDFRSPIDDFGCFGSPIDDWAFLGHSSVMIGVFLGVTPLCILRFLGHLLIISAFLGVTLGRYLYFVGPSLWILGWFWVTHWQYLDSGSPVDDLGIFWVTH